MSCETDPTLSSESGGVCVSTVSIVCISDHFTLSSQLEWLDRPRSITVARTDDADRADGILSTRACAHRDHSGACPAFTREPDLDAQRPQKRLRPPQSTGRRLIGLHRPQRCQMDENRRGEEEASSLSSGHISLPTHNPQTEAVT
jgi:hypothetical protein